MSNFNLQTLSIAPNRQSSKVTKIIISAVFYICLSLILIWGFSIDETSAKAANITIIPGMSIAPLILAAATTLYFDKESRKLLLSKTVLLYTFFIVVYTLIGWRIFGNNLEAIIADLSVFRGFYLGLFMFRLIVKSYNPKLQLVAYLVLTTLLIVFAHIQAINNSGISISESIYGQRINTGVETVYLIFLQIPFAIAIGIIGRQKLPWAILLWIIIGINFLFVGLIAAKRFVIVSTSILLLSSIIPLLFKLSNGIISKSSSILSVKKLKKILFWTFLSLAIVLTIEFSFDVSSAFLNLSVFKRFEEISQVDRSSELRVEEAIGAIQGLQDFELIVGRGMGSVTFAPNRNNEDTIWCHIGIFTFLLKGGLVLFSFFAYIFYVKFPWLYVKALLKPSTLAPKKRTALLTVLPGVFAWSISILMEGRTTSIFTIALGFGLAAYYHFKKHGLRL